MKNRQIYAYNNDKTGDIIVQELYWYAEGGWIFLVSNSL